MRKADPSSESERPLRRQASQEAAGKSPARQPARIATLRDRLGNARLARTLRALHALHDARSAPRPASTAPPAQETPQPHQPSPGEGEREEIAPDSEPRLRRKAMVSAPDDPDEREADEVAHQVMRMADPPAGGIGAAPLAVSRMCAACEEEEGHVHRAEAAGEGGAADLDVDTAVQVAQGGGSPLPEDVRGFFEPRFGQDFSHVRIHADGEAASAARGVEARAYTIGRDIVFGAGEYSPDTPGGRQLLAHELTHVVQQSPSPSPEEGRLRRRRVPSSAHLTAALPPASDTVGVMRARTGLVRIFTRAWASLTSAQQTSVQTAAAGFGLTFTDEASLRTALSSASRDQLLDFAAAIRTADPSRTLGDPALIDTGPRTGTSDAANIATVVTHANVVFILIATGVRDADIAQVFGTSNVAAAKTKYAAAQSQMNTLFAANKIVTDRSGYNDEVSLGGLTNSAQISVHSSVIDNPTDEESIVTLIHESMHAGNNDVDDFGYIDQPSFTALTEAEKLTNAAHFEVVPRRMLSMAHSFPGVTFVPAGTTVGGVTAPALTPREQAVRAASEHFRSAWTGGLNLHTIFVRLHRNPAEWNTLDLGSEYGVTAGSHFEDTLPFWSKVEALTMHTRLSTINPAGTADDHPVTIIDIALSEGLTRKMAQGMNDVPQTEADALAFETAHATSAERTAAAASVDAERDLLIRLVIRQHLGSVTGGETRDLRVVKKMAQAASTGDFSEYLRVQPPSAFP